MKLHTVGRHHLVEGDCVEVLRVMPDNSFDACVSDPPYGLGFMGKAWDCDVPGPAFAAELFRTLKPGAHACLFGGTRTFHRLAVALEDSGFEIRDCLSWLYGTGFPKSLAFSAAMGTGAAQWDGWGTALKPAWEPVLLVRKPLIGTVAANVLAHGTGGLNIDACRIGTTKSVPSSRSTVGNNVYGGNMGSLGGVGSGFDPNVGRWPANVVLDEVAAELLDAQSGERTSGANPTRRGSPKFQTTFGTFDGAAECVPARGADSGGASRFFYTAKPSRAERDRGCEALPVRTAGEATDREDGTAGISPRAGAGRTGGARNIHPTVKPAALIRWLVQLVTPPGGTVLDPFAGSGTIFLACEGLNVEVNAIERDPEYVQIAIARGSSCK